MARGLGDGVGVAGDHDLSGAVAVGHPHVAGGLLAGGRDDVVVGAQDRGHGARTAIGGRLHRRPALGDEAHAVIEAQRPRPPSSALYSPRLWPAAMAQRTPSDRSGIVHDEAEHVGGELRVLRASELIRVGVEQEVGDVAATALASPRRRSTRTGGRPRAGPSRAAGIPGRGR